jgi:pimeloyl-ACP methyl ester carboxylesterase
MPFIDIDGRSLYYTEQGNGTEIIFIHPPVLTSKNFKYQVHGLSSNFRAIAFDIRGHGKSQPSNKPVTYPLIVEDIKDLMDQLNIEKTFLCGYSTGGSVVLEFLLNYPERAQGGIVIGGMSEVMDQRLKNKISVGLLLAKLRAIGTIALANSRTNSKNLIHFFEVFKDAIKSNAKNAEQYYRYSLEYNCTDQLEKIDLPVLLVYGQKDKPFHPYAQLLQERLPKSELFIIPNVDHRIPTKATKELNQLIKQFMYDNTEPNLN